MGLFSIIGRMMLDTSDWQAGLKRTESATTASVNKMSASIKASLAGAFSAGAAIGAGKIILDHAGKIVDLADAYGLTTKQVQIMMQAEAENGLQEGQLAQITAKLGEVRQKAIEGDEKAIGVFARMGVSLGQLRNAELNNFEILTRVGTTSRARTDTLQNQADMLDLVGVKSAKAAEAVRQLDTVTPLILISDDELRKLDKVGDKISAISLGLKSLGGKVISPILDTIGRELTVVQIIETLIRGRKKSGKTTSSEGDAGTPTDTTNYDAFNGSGYAGAVQAIEDARINAAKSKRTMRGERAGSPFIQSSSEMASQGFGYFGGSYNQQVLSELKQQVSELKRITMATTKTAEALEDPAN